jgi:VIT1/CCC1 family predicted Fe2+/Mn2+ transporter/bacterioferritin (cytochrome b1)
MHNTTRQTHQRKLIEALEANWRTEMEGAATYRTLADLEADPCRTAVLHQLAEAEARHAERWAGRIRELGGSPPSDSTHTPQRVVISTARAQGLDAALQRIEAIEEEHIEAYHAQARSLDDAASVRIIEDLVRDEASHAETLRGLTDFDADATAPSQSIWASRTRARRDAQVRLDGILQQEKWHVTTGKWIGDAIYGVNDGLTAVFGIVSGVAGYSPTGSFVVVAGMAGMLASALSMGASGYLASKAEREVIEAEVARERQEVEEDPEEEAEELALFYQLKGFSEDESKAMARRLAEQPDQFLRVMAQEELGLSTDQLPSPSRAAFSATLSTAVGALIPMLPFVFFAGTTALIVSAIVSILAHFAVGAAKSLVTLRSWWVSGLEMTAVAVIVAVATYVLGALFALG